MVNLTRGRRAVQADQSWGKCPLWRDTDAPEGLGLRRRRYSESYSERNQTC